MKRKDAKARDRNAEGETDVREKAFGEIAARFGEVAKALGLVMADDIGKALKDQQKQGQSKSSRKMIGDILVEKGKITEEDVHQILQEQREVGEAKLKTPDEIQGFLAARKKGLAGERDAASQDSARTVEELEQRFVTRERAEEIAASAALDVLKLYEGEARKAIESVAELARALERHEFARKVADSLTTSVCRKALQETVGDIVHFEFEQAIDNAARKVFSSQLDTPKFATKLKEIAGASKEVDKASQRLAARLDKIEHETLPERVETLFNQRLQAKLSDLSVETIAEKLDGKALEKQLMTLSGNAVRDVMGSPDFKAVVEESLFHAAMGNIANTPEFKALLDEKFKTMIDYLSQDVIPKQIERLGGDK